MRSGPGGDHEGARFFHRRIAHAAHSGASLHASSPAHPTVITFQPLRVGSSLGSGKSPGAFRRVTSEEDGRVAHFVGKTLSGTLRHGCSVCERHGNGLRLTAAGPTGRTAGCVFDPAPADIQKVKCDRARGRSDFLTDVCDRAEGRTTFGTGGCDCAEERASVLPAGAFVRRVGRLLVPPAAFVRRVGRLLVPPAAFVRRAGIFLYRWVHLCRAPGGFPYRLALFRRGSDGVLYRCARS